MVFYVADDNSSIGIERKKKRFKTNKEGKRWIECLGIGDKMPWHSRGRKIGRIANAAALRCQCRSIEEPMSQHWEKEQENEEHA